MKKRLLQIILIIFLSSQFLFAQTDEKFSADQLKEDLHFLREKLENNHPGLYLYTDKELINNCFDSLEKSIQTPMSELEFYKHITCISSVIKDGHTIILPSERTTGIFNKTGKFLPYHFALINNELFIDLVCTKDSSIQAGARITSINDISANDIIGQLMERQVRDADNLTYPTWILNNYFREYYSYIFGHSQTFKITYTFNGATNSKLINGLSKDSIYFYRNEHYPGKTFSKIPGDGIQLKINDDKNYAVLTIKDFHNDVLRKDYKQNFTRTIKNYFELINNSKTGNLVVDLRDNQGGDIENGAYLLSYLLDKPFEIVREYFSVNKGVLKKSNGPSLGTFNPTSNSFKGKLYIFINGGSFSNSGIVSSCLKINKRAVFIGEETGGNPTIINGFTKSIKLTNSDIRVEIPTRQFVTDNTNNTKHGTMPDYLINPTIEDMLEGKDPVLQFTQDLIAKQK